MRKGYVPDAIGFACFSFPLKQLVLLKAAARHADADCTSPLAILALRAHKHRKPLSVRPISLIGVTARRGSSWYSTLPAWYVCSLEKYPELYHVMFGCVIHVMHYAFLLAALGAMLTQLA